MKNLQEIIEWVEEQSDGSMKVLSEIKEISQSLSAISSTIKELNDYEVDSIYDSPTVYQCMNFLREMVGISNTWYEVATADLEGNTESFYKNKDLQKCIDVFNSKVADCTQDKEISDLFIDEWHFDDVDGLPNPCNEIMELKFHSRIDKVKKITEWCPECEVDVDIPNDGKFQPCPKCGTILYPCSQCPNDNYSGCGTEKCPHHEEEAQRDPELYCDHCHRVTDNSTNEIGAEICIDCGHEKY